MPMELPQPDPNAQQLFDKTYVTANEIITRLGINRSTLSHACNRGTIPKPIIVDGTRVNLWERKIVMPYVDAWELSIKARRGQLA